MLWTMVESSSGKYIWKVLKYNSEVLQFYSMLLDTLHLVEN